MRLQKSGLKWPHESANWQDAGRRPSTMNGAPLGEEPILAAEANADAKGGNAILESRALDRPSRPSTANSLLRKAARRRDEPDDNAARAAMVLSGKRLTQACEPIEPRRSERLRSQTRPSID